MASSQTRAESAGWLPDINVWFALSLERHVHHRTAVPRMEVCYGAAVFLPGDANVFAAPANESESHG
jgi:hypothetical protein